MARVAGPGGRRPRCGAGPLACLPGGRRLSPRPAALPVCARCPSRQPSPACAGDQPSSPAWALTGSAPRARPEPGAGAAHARDRREGAGARAGGCSRRPRERPPRPRRTCAGGPLASGSLAAHGHARHRRFCGLYGDQPPPPRPEAI